MTSVTLGWVSSMLDWMTLLGFAVGLAELRVAELGAAETSSAASEAGAFPGRSVTLDGVPISVAEGADGVMGGSESEPESGTIAGAVDVTVVVEIDELLADSGSKTSGTGIPGVGGVTQVDEEHSPDLNQLCSTSLHKPDIVDQIHKLPHRSMNLHLCKYFG
jgi:hypothetical protein